MATQASLPSSSSSSTASSSTPTTSTSSSIPTATTTTSSTITTSTPTPTPPQNPHLTTILSSLTSLSHAFTLYQSSQSRLQSEITTIRSQISHGLLPPSTLESLISSQSDFQALQTKFSSLLDQNSKQILQNMESLVAELVSSYMESNWKRTSLDPVNYKMSGIERAMGELKSQTEEFVKDAGKFNMETKKLDRLAGKCLSELEVKKDKMEELEKLLKLREEELKNLGMKLKSNEKDYKVFYEKYKPIMEDCDKFAKLFKLEEMEKRFAELETFMESTLEKVNLGAVASSGDGDGNVSLPPQFDINAFIPKTELSPLRTQLESLRADLTSLQTTSQTLTTQIQSHLSTRVDLTTQFQTHQSDLKTYTQTLLKTLEANKQELQSLQDLVHKKTEFVFNISSSSSSAEPTKLPLSTVLRKLYTLIRTDLQQSLTQQLNQRLRELELLNTKRWLELEAKFLKKATPSSNSSNSKRPSSSSSNYRTHSPSSYRPPPIRRSSSTGSFPTTPSNKKRRTEDGN